MKTILKTALAAVMIFAATGVYAQERKQPNPEKRAKYASEKMTEKLSLDQKQSEQIYNLMLDQGKVREQRMKQAKKDRAEFDGKMKKILTPEQYEKWSKRDVHRGPGGKHNRKGHRNHEGPRGDKQNSRENK